MSGPTLDATVAVVGVVSDPSDPVSAFLDSLQDATTRPVDVVLAGPAALDPQVRAAGERRGARIAADDERPGYGAAANAGVRDTIAEFVVVANADVVWQAGALDLLLAATRRWPTGAAFGPLIHTPDGRVYPSARARPSLWRGTGHALYGWWWPSNPWTAAYRVEGEEPHERVAGWLSASCILLRRDAFDAVGGFDPGYVMYFEDLDLGERFLRAGWQSVYVPAASVVGSGRQGTGERPAPVTADQHRSAYRYLRRRYAGVRYLPLRAALRVGLGLRSVFARRIGRLAAGARPTRRDRP